MEDRFFFFFKGRSSFWPSEFMIRSQITFTDYFKRNPSNRNNISKSNCFAFNSILLRSAPNKITEQIAIASLCFFLPSFLYFCLTKIETFKLDFPLNKQYWKKIKVFNQPFRWWFYAFSICFVQLNYFQCSIPVLVCGFLFT